MTHSLGLRRLRALVGLVVVAVVAAVGAYLLRRRPPPPPPPVSEEILAAQENDGDTASQISTRFDFTRTREGRTTYQVQADRVLGLEGTVYRLDLPELEVHHDSGEVSRITGERGAFDTNRGEGRIEGNALAVLSSGITVEAEALLYGEAGESITAEGEARFSRGGIRGRGRGLEYDPRTGLLTLDREVNLEGEPVAAGGLSWILESPWLEYQTRVGRMQTGPFTLTGDHGSLGGEHLDLEIDADSSRARRLVATGGATLHEAAPAGSAGGWLAGERIEIEPDPSGRGVPARVEATGAAVLRPGTARDQGVQEVQAGRIEIRRSRPDPAAPRHLDADGGVRVWFATDDRPGEAITVRVGGSDGLEGRETQARLDAARLEARLDAASRVVGGTASGGVRYRGPRGIATGERATFEATGDRLRLAGSPGAPPMLVTPERRITARNLLMEQRAGTLLADGEVRTVSVGETGGLFDEADEPVYGAADFLRASRTEDRVVYQGAVRLWQEENLLQADRVELSPGAGTLEADGQVLTRSWSDDGEGGTQLLRGRARRLTYSQADRRAVYHDEAVLDVGGDRVEASRIEVTLDEARAVQRLLAEGEVRLRFQGTRGHGDFLDYRPAERLALLRSASGLAEAEDIENQRVVRGESLTFDLSAGTIRVESASGGRTWITLGRDPAQGAPGPQDGDERDETQPRGPAPGH